MLINYNNSEIFKIYVVAGLSSSASGVIEDVASPPPWGTAIPSPYTS